MKLKTISGCALFLSLGLIISCEPSSNPEFEELVSQVGIYSFANNDRIKLQEQPLGYLQPPELSISKRYFGKQIYEISGYWKINTANVIPLVVQFEDGLQLFTFNSLGENIDSLLLNKLTFIDSTGYFTVGNSYFFISKSGKIENKGRAKITANEILLNRTLSKVEKKPYPFNTSDYRTLEGGYKTGEFDRSPAYVQWFDMVELPRIGRNVFIVTGEQDENTDSEDFDISIALWLNSYTVTGEQVQEIKIRGDEEGLHSIVTNGRIEMTSNDDTAKHLILNDEGKFVVTNH
jgi:hypothetical protein